MNGPRWMRSGSRGESVKGARGLLDGGDQFQIGGGGFTRIAKDDNHIGTRSARGRPSQDGRVAEDETFICEGAALVVELSACG
jgi:hypothetical protein